MNTIKRKYNQLVKKYQKIENELTENEIHDKRVILRRIFPILAAYRVNPSKIKNGEKAFKLFGKLRDIQVQMLKLESLEQTPEIIKYHTYLKDFESDIKGKVGKFCKKKELEFPNIKKKSRIDPSKIISKTDKSLNKLIERIQSRSIDDAEDIHKIRIEFKKFRYRVEILSYLENIEESKLDMLKMYQDKLGEIQDYEVLITGIKKYCKKRKLEEDEMTGVFEQDQNILIENFDNQIELFIAVCRDVLIFNGKNESADNSIDLNEASGLNEEPVEENSNDVNVRNEPFTTHPVTISTNVRLIVDSVNEYIKNNETVRPVSDQIEDSKIGTVSEDVQIIENIAEVNLKGSKGGFKKKRSTEKDIDIISEYPD